MEIGKIKCEALRLMFANYDREIDTADLDTLAEDVNMAAYIVNMNGSINRALGAIESKTLLPVKSKRYSYVQEVDEYIIKLDDISDFKDIVFLEYMDADGNTEEAEYTIETNYVYLPPLEDGEHYVLWYQPSIPRITIDTKDTDTIDIPDNIAELIPYYIKGDLYRDDEPNEAAESRNMFEAGCDEVKSNKAFHPFRKQTVVKSIYEV